MPITGTFNADFKAFDDAVDQSTAKLHGMEIQAAQVGPVVDAMGTKAPTALGALTTAAGTASTAIDGVGASAQTAEQWLAGVGAESEAFHAKAAELTSVLAEQAAGLDTLGGKLGLTVASLGVVGSAALAVGVGMEAWKFGRAIAGFFDLDQAIGSATAKLLGWGDLAGAVAGANADTLAAASRHAGVAITDLGTALAINANYLGAWQSNATISATAVASWHAELTKLTASGDMASLAADLASHNFALKDLAARYHVSVEALQLFTRENTAAAAAAKAASDATHDHNARLLKDLQTEITARDEALKLEVGRQALLTRATDEYYKAVAAGSHDSVARRIEDAYLAADAQIAAMTKSKNYSLEAELMIWKAAEQTANNIIAKSLESDPYTREHYQLIADQAKIAYDFALDHASSYVTAEIQLFHDKYVAAEQASSHWAAQASDDMAKVSKSAATVVVAIAKITDQFGDATTAAAKLNHEMGGKFDVTAQNFESALADATKLYTGGQAGMVPFLIGNLAGSSLQGPHGPMSADQAAKSGYSFQEIVSALQGHPLSPNPIGPKIPGFAGGVSDYGGGWAMVGEKGPEAMYVPGGASIFPSGSGMGGGVTNIVLNLYGTQAELVQKVKDAVTRSIMQSQKLAA